MFSVNWLSPLLKIGITLASFHVSGYLEVNSMFLKNILRGNITEQGHAYYRPTLRVRLKNNWRRTQQY